MVDQREAEAPMTCTAITGARSVATFIRFLNDPLACLARLYDDGGEIVRLRLPLSGGKRRETVVLTGARAIGPPLRRVDDFRTSGVAIHGPPGSAQKRLRLGIVRANGPEHRKLRAAYAGYFERVSFLDLPSRLLPLVEEEIGSWPEDRFVDLPPLASRLVRRMAIAALFPEGDREASLRVADRIEAHARAGFAKGVLAFPFDLPGAPYRRLLTMAEEVERAIIAWADAYPRGRDAPNVMDTIHDAVGATRGAADPLVAAQIWTLLGASFETSATTLVWTTYLLAQHPTWARRGADAAAEVLAAPDPDANALLDLPELELIIRESMRVLTPVPYQRRISVREVEIGGQQFGPNTTFILSACMTNRLPELYPEPAAFRPERFESINPTPFQHLTFSAGPRRCLGYWMAVGMLKTALAVMLTRRRPELQPDQRIDTSVSITLKPSAPFLFRFPRQDGRATPPVRVRGRLAELVEIA